MTMKKNASTDDVSQLQQQSKNGTVPVTELGADKAGRSGAPSLRYATSTPTASDPSTVNTNTGTDDAAAKAKAEQEAKDAQAKADAEAAEALKQKQQKEAQEKAEKEAQDKAAAEAAAKAKADEEAKAKAEAEAKAKAEQEAKDKAAADLKAQQEQTEKDKQSGMSEEDKKIYAQQQQANTDSKNNASTLNKSESDTKDADGNTPAIVEPVAQPKLVIKMAMNDALIQQTTEEGVEYKNFRYRSRPSTTAISTMYGQTPCWGGKYPIDETKNFNAIYIDDMEFAMAVVGFTANEQQSKIIPLDENNTAWCKTPVSSPSGAFFPSMQFALSLSNVKHRDYLNADEVINKYTFGFEVTDVNKNPIGFTGSTTSKYNIMSMAINTPDRYSATIFPQQSTTSGNVKTTRPLQCYPYYFTKDKKVQKSTFPDGDMFIPYYATVGRYYSDNSKMTNEYKFSGTDDSIKPIGTYNVRMYVTEKSTGKTYDTWFKVNYEMAIQPNYYKERVM